MGKLLENYYFRIITDKETAFSEEARANLEENIFERFRDERNNVGCERSLRGSTSGRHHARCTARRPHEDLEHARCLVAFGRQMLGNSAVKYWDTYTPSRRREKGRGREDGWRWRNLRAHKATARGIQQASYLCKRQFPGVSKARSLIFPTFCERITRYSSDIFAQAVSLFLPGTWQPPFFFRFRCDRWTRPFLRRVTSFPFPSSGFLVLSSVSILLFLWRLREGTAADIAQVKPLYRSDNFILRGICTRWYCFFQYMHSGVTARVFSYHSRLFLEYTFRPLSFHVFFLRVLIPLSYICI